MMLDVGELMLGSIVAFSLGFFVCRLLSLRASFSRQALWKETKAAERVMKRLTPRERLGILLSSLPKPVVECYLDSVSPEEAKNTLCALARYSKDGVGEVGDLLLQDSAMSVLTQLSEDVPDLVVQLIFNSTQFLSQMLLSLARLFMSWRLTPEKVLRMSISGSAGHQVWSKRYRPTLACCPSSEEHHTKAVALEPPVEMKASPVVRR